MVPPTDVLGRAAFRGRVRNRSHSSDLPVIHSHRKGCQDARRETTPGNEEVRKRSLSSSAHGQSFPDDGFPPATSRPYRLSRFARGIQRKVEGPRTCAEPPRGACVPRQCPSTPRASRRRSPLSSAARVFRPVSSRREVRKRGLPARSCCTSRPRIQEEWEACRVRLAPPQYPRILVRRERAPPLN